MVASKADRTTTVRHRMGARRLVAGLAVAGLATPIALALPQPAGAATPTQSAASAGTTSITTALHQLVVEVEGVAFLAEEVVTCFNPCIVR
jgi:hypothetical protein